MEPNSCSEGGNDRYAYMFRSDMFKSGHRRFLFVCNFGRGVDSMAQLVEDVDSGEDLIRKVATRRLVQAHDDAEGDWQPKIPREISILNAIQNFKAPETDFPVHIVKCYGHEYIKSTNEDGARGDKYHSVSYWQLCNGRSIRTRWLAEGILPPTVAVARMIYQVLSTLHYLYTAGPQPVYHEDCHFGNIWAHWTADKLLPDFYLGDFADARFADSEHITTSCAAGIGLPVKDLHKFWLNMELLTSMMAARRGYQEPGVKALRMLSEGIFKVVMHHKDAEDLDPPPDLKALIYWAQEIQTVFGEGGASDETKSKTYAKFITRERMHALKVDRERGLVVFASKEDALRPGRVPGLVHVPMAIHGPWQLVRADPDGNWVPAEGEAVMHHRPNEESIPYGDDLSCTVKQSGLLNPAPYFELNTGNDDASGPSHPLFSDPFDLQHLIKDLDADADPDDTKKAPPAFFWTPGDKATLRVVRPELVIEECPSLTSSSTRSWVGQRGYYRGNRSELDNMGGIYFSEKKSFSEWLALTDNKESNLFFSQRAFVARAKRNRAASVQPNQAPAVPSFSADHLAIPQGDRRMGRPKRPTGKAKSLPKTPRHEVVVPTISVLQPLENTSQVWHNLLHGKDCKCPEETWRDDMELMLRQERMRKGRVGVKKGATTSLGILDPDDLGP